MKTKSNELRKQNKTNQHPQHNVPKPEIILHEKGQTALT